MGKKRRGQREKCCLRQIESIEEDALWVGYAMNEYAAD